MDNHIAPKQAAKILGVTTKTIQRWDKTGKIRCIRTPGGRRRIPISEIHKILGITQKRKTIGYARVSSHTQKDDLQRQIEAIKNYAEKMGWEIEIVKDIGSGLNEERRGLRKILEMARRGEIERIVITYPDRLTRFGYKTMKRLLTGYGVEIVEIENIEKTPEEELVDDLITIIVHFAGKIYGKRSHKYKKAKNDQKPSS